MGLQNSYTEFWNSFIMQIYANLFKISEKCYFSSSWPILIMFVLSDRAGWGLQNFYTEFWNSLIMQIYSKSTKNATSPLFTKINAIPQICTSGGDVYYASRNLLIHLFSCIQYNYTIYFFMFHLITCLLTWIIKCWVWLWCVLNSNEVRWLFCVLWIVCESVLEYAS